MLVHSFNGYSSTHPYKTGIQRRILHCHTDHQTGNIFLYSEGDKKLIFIANCPCGCNLVASRIIIHLLLLARNNNDTDEPYTTPVHGFCNSMSTLHYPCGTRESLNTPSYTRSTTNPPHTVCVGYRTWVGIGMQTKDTTQYAIQNGQSVSWFATIHCFRLPRSLRRVSAVKRIPFHCIEVVGGQRLVIRMSPGNEVGVGGSRAALAIRRNEQQPLRWKALPWMAEWLYRGSKLSAVVIRTWWSTYSCGN